MCSIIDVAVQKICIFEGVLYGSYQRQLASTVHNMSAVDVTTVKVGIISITSLQLTASSNGPFRKLISHAIP